MVTLKMLAKECGVSVATVSKALNGAPDISAETAMRIQRAAAQMGYTPCAAARYLKTSRSHNIGVIFSDGTNSGLTHEHFAHVLNSFKHRAEELNYDITLISAPTLCVDFYQESSYSYLANLFILSKTYSEVSSWKYSP